MGQLLTYCALVGKLGKAAAVGTLRTWLFVHMGGCARKTGQQLLAYLVFGCVGIWVGCRAAADIPSAGLFARGWLSGAAAVDILVVPELGWVCGVKSTHGVGTPQSWYVQHAADLVCRWMQPMLCPPC